MELVQSFIYSVSRVRLSLYEQRILLKVIEYAQVCLKGKLVKNMLFKMDHNLDNVKIEVPVRYILTEGSKHYEDIKQAAIGLMSRRFEYYDSDTKGWYSSPLIYNVAYVQGSGLLSFYVSKLFFDIALDFTKGFCKYDLELALSLPSPYAVRLYALLNGLSRPMTLAISDLKKMFGVDDKYKQTRDFLKKVIDPSKKILDSSPCNSFSYSRNFDKGKVVSLTFAPIRKQVQSPNELVAQIPLSHIVTKEVAIVLISYCGFTTKELAAHKVLINDFCKLPFAHDVIYNIERRARRKGKGKGYIIQALRDEVYNFKQLQVSSK